MYYTGVKHHRFHILGDDFVTIKLTRTELYNRVWKYGTSRTAKMLNTTADRIKTASLEANVPLPNNSYWSSIHMGKDVAKTPLPSPSKQLTINIPERKKGTSHKSTNQKEKNTHEYLKTTNEETNQNMFNNIQLTNYDSINQALKQIKVPKTMPTKPEPLIAEIINQAREEKKAEQTGSFYAPYRNRSTIKFHGRFGIKPTKEALIMLNTLLKAFSKANANITLTDEKNDILIALEDATLTLSCHIPSHRVILKPDDKRWQKWHESDFEPTNEKICFAIQLQHAWNTRPVHHKNQETESDYIKRIFIKTIQLIPNSRQIAHDDQLKEINQEKEKAIEAQQEEQHYEVYTKLKNLLSKARTHQVSLQLKTYIQDTNFEDQETLKWAVHQMNWLDGQESSDILKESDRQRLVDDFFKINNQHNFF